MGRRSQGSQKTPILPWFYHPNAGGSGEPPPQPLWVLSPTCKKKGSGLTMFDSLSGHQMGTVSPLRGKAVRPLFLFLLCF